MTDFGSSSYLKNHAMIYLLPDPSAGEGQGLDISADSTFFIKCRDVHGNQNNAFYKIDVCVNEGPDVFEPRVVAVEPPDEGLIGYDLTEKKIGIFTNELAECRWGLTDSGWDSMTSMECDDSYGKPSNSWGYYVCNDKLPTNKTENVYYIRCRDQPWLGSGNGRNEMKYLYRLSKPDKKISIDSIEPNQDISIASNVATVNLKVLTSGGGDLHFCKWSLSGYETMFDMVETGSERVHGLPLNRGSGNHTIYVNCSDELGDSVVGSTKFEIKKNTLKVEIENIGDFISGDSENEVNLVVHTSGGGEEHACSYSIGDGPIVEFDDNLDSRNFEEKIKVGTGDITINVNCRDEFENSGSASVSFNIEHDETPPVIARIWQSGGQLHVITIGDNECRYSMKNCDFEWINGTDTGGGEEHTLSVNRGKTYYIKCEDEFGNKPNGCSVTARIL